MIGIKEQAADNYSAAAKKYKDAERTKKSVSDGVLADELNKLAWQAFKELEEARFPLGSRDYVTMDRKEFVVIFCKCENGKCYEQLDLFNDVESAVNAVGKYTGFSPKCVDNTMSEIFSKNRYAFVADTSIGTRILSYPIVL